MEARAFGYYSVGQGGFLRSGQVNVTWFWCKMSEGVICGSIVM
jgi:hypothetical protein